MSGALMAAGGEEEVVRLPANGKPADLLPIYRLLETAGNMQLGGGGRSAPHLLLTVWYHYPLRPLLLGGGLSYTIQV